MSLLLNMLSRLVITFLPRSKCLLISWLQSPSVVILEPKKDVLFQKDVLFIIGDWNAKVGSQETPGVTGKFGLGMKQGKANRVLSRERTGHSKHPLPTTQEKTLHMDITRWSTLKSD